MIQANNYKLSELPYERPNLDTLSSDYKSLQAALQAASTPEAVTSAVMDWNALRVRYSTMDSIANTRFKQNVKDEAAKAEHQFFIEQGPNVMEWDESITQAILNHPLKASIEAAFGALFIRRMEDASRTFTPAMKEALVAEANLGQQYTALLAEGEIEFRGEHYNLSGIRKFAEDPDRATRKEALQAQQRYLTSVADKLDAMYDKLVQARHSMAQATGFANFMEFRYVQMGRTDYAPADVARFRSIVLEHVVPQAQELYTRQAERLGLKLNASASAETSASASAEKETTFFYHDEGLHFASGNPQPIAEEATIVRDAQAMYRDLSAETGEFFDMMVERELMDLSTRPNKARGGFCTSFPMYGTPFIFSNFNGTAGDITVLTHEAGHAFQVYSSSQTQRLIDYLWPTMEACEIHSFGMELFTWQWMEKFFGANADKFRYSHLEQALTFLPYSCAVDEFQEWVYTHPEASAGERTEAWKRLEATYLPWRVYEAMPFNESGRFWQTQLHIFLYPFYYIDYALAQICALQFWQKSQKPDAAARAEAFREAFADYVRICKIGGSQSFLQIVESARLRAPFDAECVRSVVSDAASWLARQTV
jgi:M3 family oligoendopeptidase